jgi:hypothetical protein
MNGGRKQIQFSERRIFQVLEYGKMVKAQKHSNFQRYTSSSEPLKLCSLHSTLLWEVYAFSIIQFYLQSVLVYSANCINNVYNGMQKSAQ